MSFISKQALSAPARTRARDRWTGTSPRPPRSPHPPGTVLTSDAAEHARDARSDAELMRLVRERDARAFELLYERHAATVMGLAHQTVGCRDGAEEATRKAFHSLWRDCAAYRQEREPARTWVLRITRGHAIDLLRRGSPAERMNATARAVAERRGRRDHEAWQRKPRGGPAVRQTLRRLPASQSDALELAYFAGLTQAEVAGVLDLPLTAVKEHMRAGLEALRETALRQDESAS